MQYMTISSMHIPNECIQKLYIKTLYIHISLRQEPADQDLGIELDAKTVTCT